MDVEQHRRRNLTAHRQSPLQSQHEPSPARQWLHASYQLCIEAFIVPLQQTLHAFEQALFTHADQARRPGEQQDYLASLQRIKPERHLFERRFLEEFEVSFQRIGEVARTSRQASVPVNSWAALELLDPASQELAMSVEQISARGEAHHSSVLHELGYRIAVLLGVPPLEGEALPMGPRSLTRLFESVSQVPELPWEHRLLMLQCFDQQFIQTLGRTYHAINAQLQANGILPQLRSVPLPRQITQRASDAAIAPRDAPGDASTVMADSSPSPATRSDSIAIMESLRDLLAQRHAGASAGDSTDSRPVASVDELQSALGALQQHLAQVAGQASRELRSAQRLREALLDQINHGKPAHEPRIQLSGEQSDTVELVAMLFEQLGEQLHRGSRAHTLLGGLQLPVLGMAVADRDFFEKREHPARKLLDTVTAAANDWLDGSDDESGKPLAAKLEHLVQRASREPPSSSLYTTLLADIEHHLSLLNRKAQAAERRHVEAAQGRERLHQARQRADTLMAERFTEMAPRGLLRALLDRAWSDVLALTLLRHGEQGEAFKAQLLITDQLLGREPIKDPVQLRREVELGLQQVGMHAEESAQVAQRLIGAGTTSLGDAGSTTNLALRLKQQHRLGEARTGPASSGQPFHAGKTPAPKVPAGDPRETAMEEHLRRCPFGSWFEFVTADPTQRLRFKLAWYSPVSGRCLLVNQRGQRGEEMTLTMLARKIVHGLARELPDEKESMLNRAWRGLTGRLHQDVRTLAIAKAEDLR